MNPIDNTCEGCKYNREDNEGNCSRYIKFENGKEKICGTQGSIGENTDGNCMLNTCPEHCFLDDELLGNGKYFGDENTSGIFSDEYNTENGGNNITTSENLFSKNESEKNAFINGINKYVTDNTNSPYYSIDSSGSFNVNKLQMDGSGINITDENVSGITQPCINGSNSGCSKSDYILINAKKDDLDLVNFRCGNTIYEYGDYDLPNIGGEPIVTQNTISRLANNDGSTFRGTKWDSLNDKYKVSENINEFYTFITPIGDPVTETGSLTIEPNNDYIIYHKNGIDFSGPAGLPNISEWFDIENDKTNPELLRLLDYYRLTTNDLSNIYNFSTNKMRTFLSAIIPTIEQVVTEKLTNKICVDQITEYGDRMVFLMGITDITMTDHSIRKIIDIFMITKDDNDGHLLESNLNALLDTDVDPSKEEIIIERLGNYTSILQLGEHPDDIRYIEKKIMKFLGTNTEDFVDVFMHHVSINSLCPDGFATRPMDILGNLLKLNIDSKIDNRELIAEKQVIKRLLKYVPSLMRKVLDISERLEVVTCDRVCKKTQLYLEIYKDLFIDSNVLKFDLPDLGIVDFFKDFNRNIYTKIILLIFIGFIVSRIISLFSVNVAVKA